MDEYFHPSSKSYRDAIVEIIERMEYEKQLKAYATQLSEKMNVETYVKVMKAIIEKLKAIPPPE
jgi:hypothetical protein